MYQVNWRNFRPTVGSFCSATRRVMPARVAACMCFANDDRPLTLTSADPVREFMLGSVLGDGGAAPAPNKADTWRVQSETMQAAAACTPSGIPLLIGNDSVHGQNNLRDSTLYPHHIGLGCMREGGAPDEAMVERLAAVSAKESFACGINWMFSPCAAVPQAPYNVGHRYSLPPSLRLCVLARITMPLYVLALLRAYCVRMRAMRLVTVHQDIRWGRVYEGFSEDESIVATLSAAEVRGIQQQPFPMAACLKHWVADGGTRYGSGTHLFFWSGAPVHVLDQGEAVLSEEEMRAVHIAAYLPALRSLLAACCLLLAACCLRIDD